MDIGVLPGILSITHPTYASQLKSMRATSKGSFNRDAWLSREQRRNTCYVLKGSKSPVLAEHTERGALQTRGRGPVLDYRWTSVADAGPTLIQHWVNAWCSIGGDTPGLAGNIQYWLKAGPILDDAGLIFIHRLVLDLFSHIAPHIRSQRMYIVCDNGD